MQLLHAAQSWTHAIKGNMDAVALANNLSNAGYKVTICTARSGGAGLHRSCHLQLLFTTCQKPENSVQRKLHWLGASSC